jgi:hypothetical protein
MHPVEKRLAVISKAIKTCNFIVIPTFLQNDNVEWLIKLVHDIACHFTGLLIAEDIV